MTAPQSVSDIIDRLAERVEAAKLKALSERVHARTDFTEVIFGQEHARPRPYRVYFWLDGEVAKVETQVVARRGGSHWRTLYRGTGPMPFTAKSVSAAAFKLREAASKARADGGEA